jgi:hypothetical protein
MQILVKKNWTEKDVQDSLEVKGKPKGRVAGGYIADLAALKKVILLCGACTHKFNPGRVGYRREKEFQFCTGTCDGCSTFDTKCYWYVYDEIYKQVRSTAAERRALNEDRAKRIAKGDLG